MVLLQSAIPLLEANHSPLLASAYLHAALAFFRFHRSCRFFQAHRHVLSLFYLTISTPDPCSYDDTGSRIFQ